MGAWKGEGSWKDVQLCVCVCWGGGVRVRVAGKVNG